MFVQFPTLAVCVSIVGVAFLLFFHFKIHSVYLTWYMFIYMKKHHYSTGYPINVPGRFCRVVGR